MPSVDQCDAAPGNLAALPSTLEIFDKFKALSENGKDSDSEESFHLPLDDDDIENTYQSISNGKEKELHNEETEDDILNKFEIGTSNTPDQLDSKIEDRILRDVDDATEESDKAISDLEDTTCGEPILSESTKDVSNNAQNNPDEEVVIDGITDNVRSTEQAHTNVQVVYDFGAYEERCDGEFRSLYESDELECIADDVSQGDIEINKYEDKIDVEAQPQIRKSSTLEVETLDNFEDAMEIEQNETEEDIANIIEKLEDPDTTMKEPETEKNSVQLFEQNDVNMSEDCDKDITTNVDMEADNENIEDVQTGLEKGEAIEASNAFLDENSENVESEDALRTPKENEYNKNEFQSDMFQNDDLLKQLEESINSTAHSEYAEDSSKNKTTEKREGKINSSKNNLHEQTAKGEKEGPDLNPNVYIDKSNDKPEEDDTDLLDISMIREAEEDDACAIADAIQNNSEIDENDKEKQSAEKFDEEQIEKLDPEQEGSDGDKDIENEGSTDNDQEPLGFDELDDDVNIEGSENDDSRITGLENDDNSNIEVTQNSKNTVVDISDNSKDSVSITTDSNQKDDNEKADNLKNMEKDDASLDSEKESNALEADFDDDQESESVVIVENHADSMDRCQLDMDENIVSDVDKTDDKANEKTKELSENAGDLLVVIPLPDIPQSSENNCERRKSPIGKRSLSASDGEENQIDAKKPKLSTAQPTEIQQETEITSEIYDNTEPENEPPNQAPTENPKVKTLTAFSKFMQCKKLTSKLSRSDLEQFCIQKICESLMLKSSEGELHQTIKKQEKTIENLRKDLQQLMKQSKDLEIVNKKLMNELRNQSVQKKPLMPLKITRSVGLQVRLNPGNEVPNQTRRRQPMTPSPQKQILISNPVSNRAKPTPINPQSAAARQTLQPSLQKSPLTTAQTTTTPTTPLLSQALQQNNKRQQQVVAKRNPAPVRKSTEAGKPGNPGVIDLTDEDDKLAANKPVLNGTINTILKKTSSPAAGQNKTITLSKVVQGKTVSTQGKPLGVQSKTVTVGSNKSNTISQGIRIAPASVISSSASGSPQMVYVVPTISSSGGGTQKVAFVNFQPTNGVISGTLNGSTVSVMSNKPGQTLTLKTVPSTIRSKHPASLPPTPRINLDSKLKPLLPKPHLTIKKIDTGIILQWKMPYNLDLYENIASYQLYAYQETSAPPSTDMWRKVGDVKALALPMACTLTQFVDKNKYYFAVRSVDVHKRIGAFSDPEEISL